MSDKTDHTTGSDNTYSNFLISPGIGYGICENYIIGLNLHFNTSKDKTGTTETKETNFGVGPFVRYIRPLGEIFSIRGQLNISYFSDRSKTTSNNGFISTESKSVGSSFDVSLVPSIGIKVSRHWALDFGFGNLGFNSGSSHPDNGNAGDDEKTKTTNFGLQLNASTLQWGVSYYFGGKKAD